MLTIRFLLFLFISISLFCGCQRQWWALNKWIWISVARSVSCHSQDSTVLSFRQRKKKQSNECCVMKNRRIAHLGHWDISPIATHRAHNAHRRIHFAFFLFSSGTWLRFVFFFRIAPLFVQPKVQRHRWRKNNRVREKLNVYFSPLKFFRMNDRTVFQKMMITKANFNSYLFLSMTWNGSE